MDELFTFLKNKKYTLTEYCLEQIELNTQYSSASIFADQNSNCGRTLDEIYLSTFPGEGCEFAVHKLLPGSVNNDEQKTKQKWWDLDYNGLKIEIKRTPYGQSYVEWEKWRHIETMQKNALQLDYIIFVQFELEHTLTVAPKYIIRADKINKAILASNKKYCECYFEPRSLIENIDYCKLN